MLLVFLKITSKLFQMKVYYKLKVISFNQKQLIELILKINFPNGNNYKRLKLINQEAIFIILNETTFPFGISLSYKFNKDYVDSNIVKDKEYEIFAYKNLGEIDFSAQLNNLVNEYQLLSSLGYSIRNSIQLYKPDLTNLSVNKTRFRIIDTPFLWENKTRQFFVNNISNHEFILEYLYDHLFHYHKFDYVKFLEKNCPKEIEKNIYAMLHAQGGLLFVGYHPENLTESIMSDVELINYYNLLDSTFSKDKYLYKNVHLQIFSFNDFPVLAITVFPLNEESKKNHAYNPDKIFVLQNNRFIKMKDN